MKALYASETREALKRHNGATMDTRLPEHAAACLRVRHI